MAAPPPVVTEFQIKGLELLKAAFDDVADKAASMSNKVVESSEKMSVNYKRLALDAAMLGTSALALEMTWTRVAEGQMNVVHAMIRSIPIMISMASAIWSIVGAETARIISSGIAKAFEGPTGWAKLAIGATLIGGVLAAAAMVPSRQFGGPIHQTGIYQLHAGEYVVPRGASPISIVINEARTPRETGDAVVDALRRAGEF